MGYINSELINGCIDMNFIITYVVYPFDVMVSFGQSDTELEKLFKKYGIKYEDAEWQMQPNGLGRCVLFDSGQTLIRLPKKPSTNADYGTLQHEIFHAVEFLFHRLNVKHSIDCGEVYAYLIGYLTTEIYKKL